MTMAESVVAPNRMHLVDLTTGEDVEMQFNPEQLPEDLQVEYARLSVPGLSHKPLQYTATGNLSVTLDLYAVAMTDEEMASIDDKRRFLHSLAYPKGNAGTINDGAPPRVLLIWPNVYTLTCVVTSLKILSTQFATDGRLMRFAASVGLEEIRDSRITSEDVRRLGSRRPASGGVGGT